MGLFDTITIGDRRGQVKCVGRTCATFGVGDGVTLYRQVDAAEKALRLEAATGDEAIGDALAISTGEATEIRDFQIVMQSLSGAHSYVVVRDGVLVDWRDDPAPDLPQVGNRGRDFDEHNRSTGFEIVG